MSGRVLFKFVLYVAGGASNSTQAIANLAAFCGTHLADRYAIEIVDVFRDPQRAFAEKVLMTPCLVVLAPRNVQRLVGTLSHPHVLLLALGLEDVPA